MLAAGVAVSSRPQPFIAVAPSRSPVNPRRHRRAGRIISILLAKASAKPPAPPEDSDDSSDVVSSSPSSASASASSASSSPPFPPPPTRAARPLNPSSRAAASKAASAAPPPPPIRARLPTTLPALPFPASEVLVPGQTKRLHLFEARYLALLDEALARRDGCLAHVVAEPLSSLRASSNNYDVTEEYTRFQSDSGSKPSPTSPPPPPPPPLVVGAYVLRLATLARVVDVRRPPASSRAPGALVTIRGEARLALLSLEDDSPYLRVSVEAAPDSAPTAEAVCGGGGGGGGCDVEDELEGGGGGEGADDEEDALVAAVLARRAQEVEALLWDVVNLSYKLPKPNAAGSDGNRAREPRRRSNGDLRISNSGRGFDDGEEDEEGAAEEEDEPLSPDPTGTIAALQSALNWAGDVPGLAPLSLSSTAAAAAASASPSPASASAAAAAPPSPASPPSLSPLAAAAERGARLGFAALQQVPHAGSPESLRSLAAARAAAMETGDTAERLGLAADFLREARAELAAKAALKALQLG